MPSFTVGPVMSTDDVLRIGAEQALYFRTPEFSSMMLENERLIKEFAKAEANARAVFMTGSGMSGGTLRFAPTAMCRWTSIVPDLRSFCHLAAVFLSSL